MPGARLAGLLACVALATGRLGLIAHELVGHGGAAIVLGGKVVAVQLFWFAGGWIRYDFEHPTLAAELAVSMAGMAVELAIGATLWLVLSKRDGLGARLVRAVGATLVIHAGWYFATSAWHGYGDGVLLHRLLGGWRVPVAIVAGLATCAVGFVAARSIFATIVAAAGGRRRAVLAMAVAGAINVGLDLGELAIRHDATYGATMAHERDRKIAADYARWADDQRRAGHEVTDASREAELRELAARHRTFPFAWLLGGLLIASVVTGCWRSPSRSPLPIAPRLVAVAGGVALASVACVILLDLVLRV